MIKIDIISGFLGSGKTTFIKRLAPYCIGRGERIVLIENEFGKVSVDGALLKCEGFDVVEITNGCICCTLKEDFRQSLLNICNTMRPDRIIFEPSGIFIPDEMFTILKDPQLSAVCGINSVIAIVDVERFARQRRQFSMFFEKQCGSATCFVLSKAQLATPEAAAEVSALLTGINANAPVYNLDWDRLTNDDFHALLGAVAGPIPEPEHGTGGHQTFMSFTLETKSRYSLPELHRMLTRLKQPEFGNVIRCKGAVMSDGASLQVNYVDGSATIEKRPPTQDGSLVFIGENLDRVRLIRLFGALELLKAKRATAPG